MTTTTLKTIDSALLLSAPNEWGDVILAMKPGAHLLLLNPIKEHHLHTIHVEDAGLEVRDTIAYVFADGENDVGMMLVMVARKPLEGTVAENTLRYGTGGLNIDECRVGTEPVSTHSRGVNGAFPKRPGERSPEDSGRKKDQRDGLDHSERAGRWPANLTHDNNPLITSMFPETGQGTMTMVVQLLDSSTLRRPLITWLLTCLS